VTWELIEGDALDALRGMPSASVDSVVTDPPAGIGFMGKDWDGDKGGRAQWVAWLATILEEARRVARPGAHALIWALPRTSHWTATAVEDAGWEVRDVITHHFGTGFPKGKGVLKPASEHWVLARAPLDGTITANVARWGTGGLNVDGCRVGMTQEDERVRAATRAVWGKALAAGSVGQPGQHHSLKSPDQGDTRVGTTPPPLPAGRWPANLVLSHAEGCELVGTKRVHTSDPRRADGTVNGSFGAQGIYGGASSSGMEKPHYADADGTETVEAWRCAEGCPVAELDRQSGQGKSSRGGSSGQTALGIMNDDGWKPSPTPRGGHADTGGASRFFPTFAYVPKSSRRERNAGLEGLPERNPFDRNSVTRAMEGLGSLSQTRANHHPTVKSITLMRWLCRLVTPPGGTVLDPFGGSGSTGVAALAEGMRPIIVEREAEYAAICRARLTHAEAEAGLP